MIYEVSLGGSTQQVEVTKENGAWRCRIAGREWVAEVNQPRPGVLTLIVEGHTCEFRRDRTSERTEIWLRGKRFRVEVRDPRSWRARQAAAVSGDGPQKLVASMPGKIVRVLRGENDAVEPGEGILVIEAMKMQNELKSPKKGIVRQVLVKQGSAVNAGDVLAIVE